MNKRLKQLRSILELSQTEFGRKINLSPDMISLLERGKRIFTERVTTDICREYNVNRVWFVDGIGEMFKNVVDEIQEYKDLGLDEQELVNLYLQLDDVTKAYYKQKIANEIASIKRAGK